MQSLAPKSPTTQTPHEGLYYAHPDQLGKKLKDLLERSYQAPYYKKQFEPRSTDHWLGHWTDIPLTLKNNIMQHSPHGFRALPLEDIFHYHESFGTVGNPMSCWYHRDDLDDLPCIAGNWVAPFGPGKIILNRFPYSFPVPAPLVESIARVKGGVIIPAGNLNWNVSYERTLELIQKMKPHILCGLPLEPLILWELAEHLQLSPKIFESLEAICLSGGVLTPSFTKEIENRFGAKVYNIYGSTEASGMASSDHQGKLRLHHEHYVYEVVHPEPPHHHVAPGETGILVVTSLTKRAMPLIRYFTRDWVKIDQPDEITLLGRIDDSIEIQRNNQTKIIHRYELDEAILSAIIPRYQTLIYFVMILNDRLQLRIGVNNTRQPIDPRLCQELEGKLGFPVQMELVAKDDLLDRASMVKTPKVFKPDPLCDWRPGKSERKVTSLSEALIEWPKYNRVEILRLMKRTLKRWHYKRKLLRQLS